MEFPPAAGFGPCRPCGPLRGPLFLLGLDHDAQQGRRRRLGRLDCMDHLGGEEGTAKASRFSAMIFWAFEAERDGVDAFGMPWIKEIII